MNVALDLARVGMPNAGVAVVSGYADRAHLAEGRALAGVAPRTLVAVPG
jgi:hypothetical protein